jgi:hypothetical protein
MQFQMTARIDLAEFHNGRHYTVVTTPAPDAFSHPRRFKLQSDFPLGNSGSSIECTVEVSGIVRERKFLDKHTGQQRTFQEADVYLNVSNFKPVGAAQPSASKAG